MVHWLVEYIHSRDLPSNVANHNTEIYFNVYKDLSEDQQVFTNDKTIFFKNFLKHLNIPTFSFSTDTKLCLYMAGVKPENTHCWGTITVQLAFSITRLDLTKKESMSLFVRSESVDF